jgi:putative SOS response-associated peptidase YedK
VYDGTLVKGQLRFITNSLQLSCIIELMCGRYGFSVKDAKDLYERFDVYNELHDLKSRYNIAPGQMNPAITRHSPNQIQNMFWGLIPFWAKDDSFRFKTINARVEGLDTKPVYKKPFRFQRCLIPATFFYEWDKTPKLINKSNPSVPYVFKLKNDSLFAFAGLYDIWKDKKSGEEITSYTIITTKANETVGKVHPRMPVILKREHEDDWLNPDITEPEHLYPLLNTYPGDDMESYQVSRAVNIPTNDSEILIQPTNSK